MANKYRKVWKVVFRKPLSGKQTQPKGKHFPGNKTKFFFDSKVFFVDPNFSGKHFPENQAKFSFDWKVFSVDQLF